MFSTAHFSATSCTTCAHTDRANARSACSEFARALMRPMSPSRLRQPASIVACMWHLRDKGKCTQHTPLMRMSCGDHALSCHSRIRTHILEESCACPSLPRSVAPSSYACDGTGTAVTALVNLHARNERTGTHGTGCACRCFYVLVALRRSGASTRPALELDCAIRRLPCLQTRYMVESAAKASLVAQIHPAQPLASVAA